MAKFRHLTLEDRELIEKHVKQKRSISYIASALCVSRQTIYNEFEKGKVTLLNSKTYEEYNTYSAIVAQQHADYYKSAHSSGLKIGNRNALAKQIEYYIIDLKYSPYHTVKALNLDFSTKTLYRYIHLGIFERLTTKHLRVQHKRKYEKINHIPRYGKSIKYRPDDINNRKCPFHWEMDCVIGQKTDRKALLVLTERFTRAELIFPLRYKNSKSVVNTLNRLFQLPYSKQIFKSITCDNGSEFSDYYGMLLDENGEKRTEIYYCHPYTSCERGSNENANRIIRYHLPKGSSMQHITTKDTEYIMQYMNKLHRKILNGKTAEQLFNELSPVPLESLYKI